MSLKCLVLTATDFCRNLFRMLEKAARGEDVQVAYSGVTFRVVAASRILPKLSRVRKRNILTVPPEDIVSNHHAVREMEAEWEAESRETGLR